MTARTRHAVLAAILGVAAMTSVYRTWGGLDRPGLYHDEKAYLLQSRIYADLKFAEPSPPVPELWEQVHVFTQPAFASRYPPGFPAVLALGTAVGKPGLIPLLCAGATAAVLFLLGSSLLGTGTAFVATGLWLAAPVNIKWRAAYFSESLTGLLWLLWSWTALRYRRDGRRADLIATSLLAACCALTRPATAAALALPIPFIVWPRLRTAIGRRDALVAGVIGLALFAIVPAWNNAVLHDWRTVPYTEYSVRTYPFDLPTLNTDWSPPPRALPPDMQALGDVQRKTYEGRSVAVLARDVVSRMDAAAKDALPGGLSWLRFLAPIGLLLAGSLGIWALASFVLLVLSHILMPHEREWTIYYLDVFPVVAAGVVLAVRAALYQLAAVRNAPLMRGSSAGVAVGALLILCGQLVWRAPRVDDHAWSTREVFLRSGLCALPDGPKTVFVQARPDASPHHGIIENDPRWDRSDTWVVRYWDSTRTRLLIDAAPERVPYFYDEKAAWIARMGRDGIPTREGVLNVLRMDHRLGRSYKC
jgi:hypothetical protein